MSTQKSGGIGFWGALTLVFIVLKLCSVISWSWFWVLSPIWIIAAILVVLLILLVASGALFKARNR